MEKTAVYYLGKIATYRTIGLSRNLAKYALTCDGMSTDSAEALIKQAGWVSGVGKGLGWLGGHLGSGAKAIGSWAKTRGAQDIAGGAAAPGMLSGAAKGLGRWAGRTGKSFGNAGSAFVADPSKALSGGAKEFGKGLFGGGKGLGAGLGKATTLGTAGYGAYSMVRPNPKPQYQ